MENQLVKVINESGLDKSKAQVLLQNFSNYFEIAADWENKAKALTVTREDQRTEMKMAREGRLFLKQKRVDVEKTRKQLKEASLREGQTIDAIAKILTNLIVPIEEDLENKERFAEIQEANRKAILKSERELELQPYAEFVPYGLELGSMGEDDYLKVLKYAKAQLQEKLDAEKKVEEDRIAKEKAEAAERERMRLENERLKKEAEEKEKLLAKERLAAAAKLKAEQDRAEQERLKIEEANRIEKEKADAILKAEQEKARKEREAAEATLKAAQEKARIEREQAEQASRKAAEEKAKLEAEIKAKADAEEKARKEQLERVESERKAKELAEKKAKAAPDKNKLLAFAKQLDDTVYPDVSSEEAIKVNGDVKTLLAKVTNFIREKANKL